MITSSLFRGQGKLDLEEELEEKDVEELMARHLDMRPTLIH